MAHQPCAGRTVQEITRLSSPESPVATQTLTNQSTIAVAEFNTDSSTPLEVSTDRPSSVSTYVTLSLLSLSRTVRVYHSLLQQSREITARADTCLCAKVHVRCTYSYSYTEYYWCTYWDSGMVYSASLYCTTGNFSFPWRDLMLQGFFFCEHDRAACTYVNCYLLFF
jgi:hypothetical protein